MAKGRAPFGHELTHTIIGGFFEVHNTLGCGLLEGVYAAALQRELELRGLFVDREFWVDVLYKDEPVARQRLDMIVNYAVVIEIKASENLPPIARRQLLSYLRSTRLELGLVLHFGQEPKVHRLVDTNKPSLPRASEATIGGSKLNADAADLTGDRRRSTPFPSASIPLGICGICVPQLVRPVARPARR